MLPFVNCYQSSWGSLQKKKPEIYWFFANTGGGGGIGNKAQLRPAIAGAGAWPELGKNSKMP